MVNNSKYNELFLKEKSEEDPLNQPDFEVVSYINKIFPHGILFNSYFIIFILIHQLIPDFIYLLCSN